MVSLDDAKNYLRIDNEDDDGLIQTLLDTAVQLCTDISRCDDDHHDLTLTLRSLLFSLREGVF